MRLVRRTAIALAILAGAAISGLPGTAPQAVRGAEYTVDTSARYDVRPEDGWIDVTVDVAFTNTTPDPAGQFSVFNQVKLAVHDAAVSIAATDAEGAATVRVTREGGGKVATVSLRTQVRYQGTAQFTLSYRLPHDGDEHLRVSPSLIAFPSWGFGTSSDITVTLPTGYEVRVDGDALDASLEPSRIVLRSGPISDPTQWLALVVASRPASYTTLSAAVPLSGGTADVQVRAFAEDADWGERTLDLLERGLPLLEERIGLPYPAVGPLVVTEAVGGGVGFGETLEPGTEIAVGFDQPPFTALHQVAHVWIGPPLIESRWIQEGLASWAAAGAAAELDLPPPYEPAAEARTLAADAFPLDTWPVDPSPEQERWAYAAAWAFVDELAAEVGDDGVRDVIERAAAGIGPYEAAAPNADAEPRPIDSRTLLDWLDTGSGVSIAERFGEVVLSADDAALLASRTAARTAYDGLLVAAGTWGAPDPVRGALDAWSFDAASDQIDAALNWLAARDELIAAISAVGLAAPVRLELAYRTHGGGPDAQEELDAEGTFVRAYTIAIDAANAPRSLLERIGLIGGTDPAAELALAHGRFADGDLRGAAEAITAAQSALQGAEAGGITRLFSIFGLIVLLAVAAAILLRRRRPAAPGD